MNPLFARPRVFKQSGLAGGLQHDSKADGWCGIGTRADPTCGIQPIRALCRRGESKIKMRWDHIGSAETTGSRRAWVSPGRFRTELTHTCIASQAFANSFLLWSLRVDHLFPCLVAKSSQILKGTLNLLQQLRVQLSPYRLGKIYYARYLEAVKKERDIKIHLAESL
jgi:hypothetical protein